MTQPRPQGNADELRIVQGEIVACRRCPRLVRFREEQATVKRAQYRDQVYWGKPVPSFGEVDARILVLGLAPAAHGGNRSGRMFTGDGSSQFLFRALYDAGFATMPNSWHVDDGQQLLGCYLANAVRCAPPDNLPTRLEQQRCSRFLAQELALLTHLEGIVALGGWALDAYLSLLLRKKQIAAKARFRFGHKALHRPTGNGPWVLCSYHPSQQNTATGRLTPLMMLDIFLEARRLLDGSH